VTSGCEAAARPPDPGFDDAVESLIRKGGGAAAEADAIDWSVAPVRPRWATHRAYVEAVSQLLHAERLTGRACSHLARALPEPAARRFIESQARDEARHAHMYDRYLARLGDVAPMDEALESALDGALRWRDSIPAMMVAFNVVLEGEAVHLHGAAARVFPCPLLRRIATAVGRDEARHVAFGRIYLTRALAGLDEEERRAIYRDVEALWRAIARPSAGDGRGGAILRRAWRGYMAARWRTHCRAFERIGLIRAGEELER
jgi:hypothetical protein